jgi:hypothetical protein
VRRAAIVLLATALCSGQALAQAMDPVNRTCPRDLNWSNYPSMQFTYEVQPDGSRILKAEGRIDSTTPAKLQDALEEHPDAIDEVWLRSPGGDARAGTQAGFLIRQNIGVTKIPRGWACFSACNFMFMGGQGRIVEPGGLFIVHMFTHVGDGSATRQQARQGGDQTVGLIGEIEQASALLASEDNDFLIRMGISRNLLTEVMYQVRAVPAGPNAETRRCLTQEEMRRYNVTQPIEFEG